MLTASTIEDKVAQTVTPHVVRLAMDTVTRQRVASATGVTRGVTLPTKQLQTTNTARLSRRQLPYWGRPMPASWRGVMLTRPCEKERIAGGTGMPHDRMRPGERRAVVMPRHSATSMPSRRCYNKFNSSISGGSRERFEVIYLTRTVVHEVSLKTYQSATRGERGRILGISRLLLRIPKVLDLRFVVETGSC